ncbi:MAG TPA: S41 family peptidase, partial [Pyrinomonadaceae bacterium]
MSEAETTITETPTIMESHSANFKPSAEAGGASAAQAAAAQAAAAGEVAALLGEVQSLPEFLKTTGQLTLTEREQIVNQALVMIEEFYVHLPLKRAMYAVDPVQALRLLRQRQSRLSESAFHDAMVSIYVQLRDLHTNYVRPEPYRSRTAFVPFRIEEFFTDDHERHYLVTQVAPMVTDAKFKPGVVVTHWNNIPIERAVEVNAEREAGSNLDARHARGLSAMTIRWMGMSLAPDEEQVTIRYLVGEEKNEIQFEWKVIQPDAPASGVDLLGELGPVGRLLGVDAKTEVERRMLKLLFAPAAVASERLMAVALPTGDAKSAGALVASTLNLGETSTMPDVFSSFKTVETPDGKFGYIRIRTFNVSDYQAFIEEFRRLLQLLPQNGLIIDLRGNGGGLITAGERLLQLLTPKQIEPARLHFINTPLTLRLCQTNQFIEQWKDSIEQSIETGASFSQGFSLLPVEQYNDIGQKYQGPVVLIVDALCYSTTDIFVAGFQDHQIGKILGTSGNTGAGGANVWTHGFLSQLLPGQNSPFAPLPKGASFRVAIRRTTRVGARASVPVEDLGVLPDDIHPMTRDDVLEGNVDLINHAARMLPKMVYSLVAGITGAAGETVQVKVNTRNLTRVDALVNKRPR